MRSAEQQADQISIQQNCSQTWTCYYALNDPSSHKSGSPQQRLKTPIE